MVIQKIKKKMSVIASYLERQHRLTHELNFSTLKRAVHQRKFIHITEDMRMKNLLLEDCTQVTVE